ANSTGNENYTGAGKTYFANITKAPATANISAASWSIQYGSDASINCSIDNSQSNLSLYRNDTLLNSSLGSNFSTVVSSLAAGAYNFTCNATESENYSASLSASSNLTVTLAPTIPPSGGSSQITPQLVYSFNCTSGLLAISAKTGGSPVSGLSVRLKDPAKAGYLSSATTGSSGIASFAIANSGRYSAESAQTSAYSQAYLGAFSLAFCNNGQLQPPANQTQQQPPTPALQANATLPQANQSGLPAINQTALEKQAFGALASARAALEQASAKGADTSAASGALAQALLEYNSGNYAQALELAKKANELAQAKPAAPQSAPGIGQAVSIEFPPAAKEIAPPAISLAIIGGGVFLVLAAIGGYLFMRKKK
ncbi:MAG: hypothetical protein WC861_04465, partial [Candidatus Micrarchaeia archaeon]